VHPDLTPTPGRAAHRQVAGLALAGHVGRDLAVSTDLLRQTVAVGLPADLGGQDRSATRPVSPPSAVSVRGERDLIRASRPGKPSRSRRRVGARRACRTDWFCDS
jgi:hypothetical protein